MWIALHRTGRSFGKAVIILGAAVLASTAGHADENGVSVWLPGSFGSLAAVPVDPGWSLGTVYYHTSVWGGAGVATAREISIGRFSRTLNVTLGAKLNSQADIGFISPAYLR